MNIYLERLNCQGEDTDQGKPLCLLALFKKTRDAFMRPRNNMHQLSRILNIYMGLRHVAPLLPKDLNQITQYM
jgi:hypothetical protein